MKRFIYMVILIVLAALSSFAFSFVGADKFLFYTFFFFIGAYLCGLKTTPVLMMFLAADYFILNTEIIYLLQLFLFVLTICVVSRKLKLYPATIVGYALSYGVCMILRGIAGQSIFVVFDKWLLYLITFIIAPPFVFALMRAGIIRKRRVMR